MASKCDGTKTKQKLKLKKIPANPKQCDKIN